VTAFAELRDPVFRNSLTENCIFPIVRLDVNLPDNFTLRKMDNGVFDDAFSAKSLTKLIQANAISVESAACFTPQSLVVFSNSLSSSTIPCSRSTMFRSFAR
jgi:hypothetical protein